MTAVGHRAIREGEQQHLCQRAGRWNSMDLPKCHRFQYLLSSFALFSLKGENSSLQQRTILPCAPLLKCWTREGEGDATCMTEHKDKYSPIFQVSFSFQTPALTVGFWGRSEQPRAYWVGDVAGEGEESWGVGGFSASSSLQCCFWDT